MKNFNRAISDEQKKTRRQEILDSALAIFDEAGFKGTNIAEVARRSGIAKGSVFLYFKTKEELFMNLLAQELGKWNDEYDECIKAAVDKSLGKEELAGIFSGSLMKNTRLIRLVALVNNIFEQNLDRETVAEFKKGFIARIRSTGELLDSKVSSFNEGDGMEFYMHCYILVTGLANITNPVPAIKDVIKSPGYQVLDVNMGEYLYNMLVLLLKGMDK